MSEAGPSVSSIHRTGSRKEEFDNLFYMPDLIRRQYILDRYLKRAKKGDTSSAIKARKSAKPDEDLEDFKEIVMRRWISGGDIIKYYSGKGVIPPLIPVYEELVLSRPFEPSIKLKNNPKVIHTYPENKNKIPENPEEFKAYFDKLEKREGKKTENKKLKDLGFASGIVKNSKNSLLEILSNEFKKYQNATGREAKSLDTPFTRDVPMWVKERNAKNYKNESYIKQQEKFKNQVRRPVHGKTRQEIDDELITERLKKLKLEKTIPLQERLKTINLQEKRSRPTTEFLETEPERKRWKRMSKLPMEREKSISPISSRSSNTPSSRRGSTSSLNSNKSVDGYDDE